MKGHQKYLLRNDKVWLKPGWQVKQEVWAQWRTFKQAESGTKSRPGGPLSWSGWVHWALVMMLWISQVSAATTLVGDTMVSGWKRGSQRKKIGRRIWIDIFDPEQ